jgi:hypothetical protein
MPLEGKSGPERDSQFRYDFPSLAIGSAIPYGIYDPK